MDRQSRFADGMGLAARQTNGRGGFRGCEFRRSATLTLRGEGFETDNLARQSAGMRRAATMPHGSATCMEKITMLKFEHLTLHVMRGLDPRIHDATQRRKPYVVALHHGWPEQVRP